MIIHFLNVKKNQKIVDRYFGMLKTIFTTIHNHNVLQWNMIIILKYFYSFCDFASHEQKDNETFKSIVFTW
jgi:hypothetical protein